MHCFNEKGNAKATENKKQIIDPWSIIRITRVAKRQ